MKRIILSITVALAALASFAQGVPQRNPTRFDFENGITVGKIFEIPFGTSLPQVRAGKPAIFNLITGGDTVLKHWTGARWKTLADGVGGLDSAAVKALFPDQALKNALSTGKRILYSDNDTVKARVLEAGPNTTISDSIPGKLIISSTAGGNVNGSQSIIKQSDSLRVSPNYIQKTTVLNATTAVAMRNFKPVEDGTLITTQGYWSANGKGSATYRWFATNTDTEDSVETWGYGIGRFKLVLKNHEIDAQVGGVVGDGVVDDLRRLQATSDWCAGTLGRGTTLTLPNGRIRITGQWNVGITSVSFASYGWTIRGKGPSMFPYYAEYGGTCIYYDGPSGAGTNIVNLKSSLANVQMEEFVVTCAYNDAVDVGINLENAKGTTFTFRRLIIGMYAQMPTYGVKWNKNGFANAEFTTWYNCSLNGTLTAYWQNSGQSLSNTFYKCNGSVMYGGKILDFVENGGAMFNDCDFSGLNGGIPTNIWAQSTNYQTKGQYIRANGNSYRSRNAGTSASSGSGPSGTGTGITDGSIVWDYVRPDRVTTFMALGGPDSDPVKFNGGRAEIVGRLLEVYNDANSVNVTFEKFTMTVPSKATGQFPDWIVVGNNSYTNVSIDIIKGAFVITGGGGEAPRDYIHQLPMNIGGSNTVQIHMDGVDFAGCWPTLKNPDGQPVTPTNSGAGIGAQQLFSRVWAENCKVIHTLAGSQRTWALDKVYLDNTPNGDKSFKQENLLTYSSFGTNRGFIAPTGWTLVGGSQIEIANLAPEKKEATNTEGVTLLFGNNQRMYQDIPQGTININSAQANIVGYKATIAPYYGGKIRFALENSSTGEIYDEWVMQATNGTTTLRQHEVELNALIRGGQPGLLRVVIENLSATNLIFMELYKHYLFTSFNARYIGTTASPISRVQTWESIVRTEKVTQRLQVPVLPSSVSTTTAEPEGDLNIDRSNGNLQIYSDRWQAFPGQDRGTAPPASGAWKANWIRWNTDSTSSTVAWRCTVGGVPGTWVAFGGGSSSLVTRYQPYGSIINDSAWSNMTDSIVANGATASINSGKIAVSGGTGNYSQTIDINKTLKGTDGNTNLEQWRISSRIRVASTGNGFGLGTRSNSTYGNYYLAGRYNSSNGTLYINATGVDVATLQGPSVSVNDEILLTLERKGLTVVLTAQNVTTNGAVFTLTYPYNLPGIQVQNNGRFAIYSFGGNFTVNTLDVSSNETMNADLMIVSDSKYLYNATNGNGWSTLIKQNYETAVSSGGYERTEEWLARVGEMISLKPQNVIIAAPSNDARTGQNTDTTKARITRLEKRLRDAGINVYLMDGFYETQASPNPYASWVNTTKSPDSVIRTLDITRRPGALDPGDNIHLTNLGHQWVYEQVVASNKIKPFKGEAVGITASSNAFIQNQTAAVQSAGFSINGDSKINANLEVGNSLANGTIDLRINGDAGGRGLSMYDDGAYFNTIAANTSFSSFWNHMLKARVFIYYTGDNGNAPHMQLAADGSTYVYGSIYAGDLRPGIQTFRVAENQRIAMYHDGTNQIFLFGNDNTNAGNPAEIRASTFKFRTFPTSGGSTTAAMDILPNGNIGINNTNPTAKLHVGGSIASSDLDPANVSVTRAHTLSTPGGILIPVAGQWAQVTTLSTTTTINTTMHQIEASASAGSIQLSLPTTGVYANGIGIEFVVVKVDNTANGVTIVGTINGTANRTINTQYSGYRLRAINNSGEYRIVGTIN